MSADEHIPVLLQPTVDALLHTPDGLYLDCTFGRGGHSRALLEKLSAKGQLVALDRDPQAVQAMGEIKDSRFRGVRSAFADLESALDLLGIDQVDGVLMDIGVSSPQIDQAERGFSFRRDGPLDMRMDPQAGESAADFLARAEAREIKEVIKNYGEERFAVQIATAIVARRAERPITTTLDLAQIVAGAVRTREPGQDPATRTFQALRIHVNQELAQLEQGLTAAFKRLKVGGRLAVISFHSLEDRITKQFIEKLANPKSQQDARLRKLPLPEPTPLMRKLDRIKPSKEECELNPRSRSSVLRVAEKLAEWPAGSSVGGNAWGA
ncbi:MAG: 16S rRNA (cytosine(1402)-N(4))-methyltransferase RsmH [Limnobacter sp.]|uniref:Ribosomal RNA small subunit methyltransferase H n=2 Tax=Limnobacter TaxID=131079 RepID=A0ABX6N839_9BURK|nr:16S rRNA (cytosine(1402)-N(4))-methyltransferase RsmH [Limnobacter sp.]MDZ4049978.1 16S rRNA (cytosine(1402)-N(4))-methyltransferase RsmH [Limnobacter sp.]QJR30550.1 16S rRNA (cytosine(1402)-N(4))-methyltransferase RsmH [Limnobacter sp. SAORIC-580]RZO90522.1 MAG: 16S rRNA (cytosine(1402)-N(4))-methyltransferase RsmH [Limnobacter sp.]